MRGEIGQAKNGLRRGFTTGSCAAAAAKGATIMLFSGDQLDEVEITLPGGETAVFGLIDKRISKNAARCCVVKDAGDDPDVTHGARICAEVTRGGEGIELRGGEGVGVVTKPGLQVEVGMPAINPVPRRMITQAVEEVLPAGEGVVVTIIVPEGRRLAKRTMNSRLGVEGGISILGTTGIVEPMSVEALKSSLLPQIDVAMAAGYDEVILTPGRMGEKRAMELGIPREAVVITSNYVGFMLEKCREKGIRRVLLLGHMGKLIKIAVGERETHSRASRPALKVIREYLAKEGLNGDIIEEVRHSNTTEEALAILRKHGCMDVLYDLAREIGLRASEMGGGLEVGVLIFSMKGDIVGRFNIGGSKWERFLL